MEKVIFNDDNLNVKDVVDHSIKTRAIIINDNNEILLCKYADMYLLPGGKVEAGKTLVSGLEAEIKEETGIIFKLGDIEPFLLIQQYIKKYPKRNNIDFANRLSETYYFIINSNEELNLDKRLLTESELSGGFSVSRIAINEVPKLIMNHQSDNPKAYYFKRELLTVIEKYNEFKNI